MDKNLYIIGGCNGAEKQPHHIRYYQVDYWDIYDNSNYPRKQIACGGNKTKTVVF